MQRELQPVKGYELLIVLGFVSIVVGIIWFAGKEVKVGNYSKPENHSQQVLPTLDNAPLGRIGGVMTRYWDGNWHTYRITQVNALTPTHFSIICEGNPGNILAEYDKALNNGKGRWEDKREVGGFTVHPLDESTMRPSQWAGRMADDLNMTKHVDDFAVKFEVTK